MSRLTLSLVFSIACFLVIDHSFAQSANISGQWRATGGTLNGQQVPQTAIQTMSLNVTGTTFSAVSGTLTSAGNIVDTGTPNRYEFHITGGADIGRVLHALCRLEGNILTIAFSEAGPPTGYESTSQNRQLSMTYQGGAGALTGVPNQGNQQSGGSAGVVD